MVKKSVQMYNFYTLKIRIARRTASSHSLIIYLFSSCLGTWLILLVAASSMFTSTRCYLECFCHNSPRCFVFAVALHVYMPDYEDVFVICVDPIGLFLPCPMFSVARGTGQSGSVTIVQYLVPMTSFIFRQSLFFQMLRKLLRTSFTFP